MNRIPYQHIKKSLKIPKG